MYGKSSSSSLVSIPNEVRTDLWLSSTSDAKNRNPEHSEVRSANQRRTEKGEIPDHLIIVYIVSDIKWCIHLSRSLVLYIQTLAMFGLSHVAPTLISALGMA